MNKPVFRTHAGLLLVVLLAILAPPPAGADLAERVADPPDHSYWVIRHYPSDLLGMSNEEANAFLEGYEPSGRRIDRIHVSLSGENRREITRYTDGTQEEFWAVGEYLMSPSRRTGTIITRSSDAHYLDTNYSGNPFPDLAWIADATPAGRLEFRGRPCYVYRLYAGDESPLLDDFEFEYPEEVDYETQLREEAGRSAAAEPEPTPAAEAGERIRRLHREAYIDANTRLPVAITDGQYVKIYTFGSLEGRELRMPENFQREWERFQEGVARYQRRHIPQ